MKAADKLLQNEEASIENTISSFWNDLSKALTQLKDAKYNLNDYTDENLRALHFSSFTLVQYAKQNLNDIPIPRNTTKSIFDL